MHYRINRTARLVEGDRSSARESLWFPATWGNHKNPTTELFYLLLTVKTRIADARPHLRALKKLCGTWNQLPDVPPDKIRPILDPLGFGAKRTKILMVVADRIRHDFSCVSLNRLKRQPIETSLAYLRTLPFVGEKVARCVALYTLNGDISPMDTHATRVLSRTGVLPRDIDPKKAHAWIDRLVEPGASYRLHVNLLAHGQQCCKAIAPQCTHCPLILFCRYARLGR